MALTIVLVLTNYIVELQMIRSQSVFTITCPNRYLIYSVNVKTLLIDRLNNAAAGGVKVPVPAQHEGKPEHANATTAAGISHIFYPIIISC